MPSLRMQHKSQESCQYHFLQFGSFAPPSVKKWYGCYSRFVVSRFAHFVPMQLMRTPGAAGGGAKLVSIPHIDRVQPGST